jgi:hypothetical protein
VEASSSEIGWRHAGFDRAERVFHGAPQKGSDAQDVYEGVTLANLPPALIVARHLRQF